MKKFLFPFFSIVMYIFRIIPINKRRIVFESFFGTSYNDNPKAISDKLKNKGLELIWIVKNKDNYNEEGIRFVNSHSISCLYYLSTSKIWIDNCRKPIWVKKRKNQYYIQTWHAGISNKLGEQKTESELTKDYVKAAKHDSKLADVFLSNSKWLTDSYLSSFWYSGKVLEYGLPREDILLNDREKIHNKVCDFYGIPRENKLVLYAPTFRNSGNLDVYDLDYNYMINTLRKDGDWSVLIRLHPNVNKNINVFDKNVLLDGSLYPEINDLIMASEIVISDYSSCMFDAMLAGCKVIIYASDIEEYKKERGFAFEWEELPFPLARNNNELERVLSDFNEDKYIKNVELFKDKCGVILNGNASERVGNHILSIINNEKI